MKQKFKDIIKNKWGWAGAIAGGVYQYATDPWATIVPHCSDLPCLSDTCAQEYCNINPALNYIPLVLFIVVGFIAGLIAQKLWRKIK